MTEKDHFKDSAEDKTHLILVNVLVHKKGKLLISQRSFEEPHEPGSWTIPGGKVERTPGNVWNIIEKTLHDEVLEETGVELENVPPILVTNNTFIRSTGQHVVALVFLSNWISCDPRPLEDTIDVRWVTQDEIENYTFAPNVSTYLKKGFEIINNTQHISNPL